jgi:hypothetical protein
LQCDGIHEISGFVPIKKKDEFCNARNYLIYNYLICNIYDCLTTFTSVALVYTYVSAPR